jgi:hypothetical protein
MLQSPVCLDFELLSQGVAVYYLSPKWPFPINVYISVDNGEPVQVDLTDYNKPQAPNKSAETVPCMPVWGAELSNDSHTVVVSMGDSVNQFVVVDAFKYSPISICVYNHTHHTSLSQLYGS